MSSGKMSTSKELMQMDLYGLLAVPFDATEKEIKKAYRLKALTCHPDKNPDNPRAAELFHQLSQALEVLTDGAARAAYDKLRKAKEAAALRTQKLDDKRKKVKLDLEAREREAQVGDEEVVAAQKLEQEIIRLREEGARQLEEQQRLVREQIKSEINQRLQGKQSSCSTGETTAKIKLKWKCKKDDVTRGGYSEAVLMRLLQKYGEVHNVLVSSKKGTAIVEFATLKAAELAVKYETGLLNNPLSISWIGSPPPENISNMNPRFSSQSVSASQGPLRSERDFESLVLMKMRQAAERQRLIEQMQKEDEESKS
ncbi:dnaJ homolog subfamily C member 17 [Spea bombifrons]|uniref:dnaJ homolog subfamily C member 17 n=1 Tax=Spea bombifrons TaxID=233779 RepID=UPI00234A2B6D|nr:dnaJ homolog subfamily C member 17 [Spea bombifrons]